MKNGRAVTVSWRFDTYKSMTWPMVNDGAVDVTPHARRLHIGFVDEPAVTDGISVRVGCVDQYRCEALHPSEQRDVINLDTAVGEKFFEIAV